MNEEEIRAFIESVKSEIPRFAGPTMTVWAIKFENDICVKEILPCCEARRQGYVFSFKEGDDIKACAKMIEEMQNKKDE